MPGLRSSRLIVTVAMLKRNWSSRYRDSESPRLQKIYFAVGFYSQGVSWNLMSKRSRRTPMVGVILRDIFTRDIFPIVSARKFLGARVRDVVRAKFGGREWTIHAKCALAHSPSNTLFLHDMHLFIIVSGHFARGGRHIMFSLCESCTRCVMRDYYSGRFVIKPSDFVTWKTRTHISHAG